MVVGLVLEEKRKLGLGFVFVSMGCGGSKIDDLPLVTLCKERRDLIKAASDHRYALAASHVTYFHSLKDVGDALRRFVDEELVIAAMSSSSPGSPVLTLPSDEGKKKKKKKKKNNNDSSSSPSITHSASATISCQHSPDNNNGDGSHLHLSESGSGSGSETDSDSSTFSEHIHHHHENNYPEQQTQQQEPFSFPQYNHYDPNVTTAGMGMGMGMGPMGMNSYSSYYMKRSTPPVPSMYYEEPKTVHQWPSESSNMYPGYPQYGGGNGGMGGGGGGGYFGGPMSSGSGLPAGDPYYDPTRDPYYNNRPQTPLRSTPPSPPPPQVSTWDFLNPFDSVEDAYPTYFSRGSRYGVGSISSSPDSVEVRKREGIPDLEEEITQQVPVRKGARKDKQKMEENIRGADSGEGTSRTVPLPKEEIMKPVEEKEMPSNTPEISESKSTGEEEITRKKGVSFEVDKQSAQEIESSEPSSLTTLSLHGIRDIEEVVKEIKDEFDVASDYGKEVAVMLEVGKLPYQSRSAVLKVISSRILNLVAPPILTHSHQSRRSRPAAAKLMKIAKAKYGDSENDFRMKSGNLSSTLEKLYAWEKKLYKEVKDEERLRVLYEKECKRLKVLDRRGAESNKIDASQASIRKLLTKLNVTIRAIAAISIRIQKLRDEELQPQITELIHGLIRMWNSMLKCHQKQFQAIIESKSHTLVAKTGAGITSSLRATVELEEELLNWSSNFNDWISTQKAYVESLNGWLLQCLSQEPEETPGVMPFSPCRAGAPSIFIICNDWYQAMERLSESEVANTMTAFALSLHQLWERQDEEHRQRLKAEYLSKDFEKRLKSLRKKESMIKRDRDTLSEKSAMSVVPTESGVSPLDDLKVDLDSMKKRLEDERARHKETVKQVHEAASSSLQAGLIPIFEALRNFTSETLKAYEDVRLQKAGETT